MSTVSTIIEKIPPTITNIFGGNDILMQTTGLLAWNPKFSSGNYINLILPEHMPEHNVSVGLIPTNVTSSL